MLAVEILAIGNGGLKETLTEYRKEQAEKVLKDSEEVSECSIL